MKKLIRLFIALIITLTMVGCTKVETVDGKKTSMFEQIESAGSWIVVYHKETKVMYAVSNGDTNRGTFTVLLDSDGNPLLYIDTIEENYYE
jgi:hypothetical protein